MDTRNKADKSAKAGMGGKLSNAIKELANNTALNMAQDGQRKKVRPASYAWLPLSCTCHSPVLAPPSSAASRKLTRAVNQTDAQQTGML